MPPFLQIRQRPGKGLPPAPSAPRKGAPGTGGTGTARALLMHYNCSTGREANPAAESFAFHGKQEYNPSKGLPKKESGDEMKGIVSMISELDRLDKELKLAAGSGSSGTSTACSWAPARRRNSRATSLTCRPGTACSSIRTACRKPSMKRKKCSARNG